MAQPIDSISIELTASTQSAENSIQRVIDMLGMLNAMAIDTAESKVSKSIRSIAKAAKEVDTDAGQKLARLAGGLKALSKVGDLSNLADAGKNLSSVVRAVNSMGQSGGKGLSNLANGIKQTSDALGGIKDADVSKLNAVKDALSGEMSGSLHTSARASESASLGGMGTPKPSFGNMAAYGAMTVFKYTADSIRDATAAYQEFRAALGAGIPPIFTDYSDSANVGGSMRLLTAGIGNQEGPWIADEIRDATGAANEFGSAIGGSGAAIETEFVNANSELRRTFDLLKHLKIAALNVGIVGIYLGANLGTAIGNIAKSIAKLGVSIVRIAKYRLIRAMLKDMSQSFKDLYGWSQAYGTDFARSMDTINTAFVYLRNSIAAMVAPLVNALAPALDFVIDKVVEVLNWFNQLFAALSGASTYTVAKKVAQSWGNSFDSTSGKAKQAADSIKRTILGFDEINKLTKQNESSSGSVSGSSPYSSGYTTMFEEKPLTGGFKGISDAMNTEIEDRLSQITSSIGKYELAIGALLVLSKANVPLGLGLMASGAAMMGSAIIANWDGIPDEIKTVIGAVEAALGGGLAVGAILAFSSGNIGLGIGMMVAALSLEWSAVDIVWTTLKNKIGGQIQAIGVLLGGATFGLGAVLAFAGHPGIGIAMMIAGSSVAAVSINWNFIKEKLQGPIGEAVAVVSAASLVLGILALLAGAVPIGLGLIVSGAAGLATTIAANWDNLVKLGKTAISKVKEGWESVKLAVSAAVSLVKDGWTNLTTWVGEIADKGVKLFKNGWITLTAWVGEIADKGVKLFKNGWTTITAWAGEIADKGVKLFKNGWTSLTNWVGEIADKGVKLFKNGWTTITAWVGEIGEKGVKLVKDGWTSLTDWVGEIADKSVNLTVKIIENVSDWFKKFFNWFTGNGQEATPSGPAWGESSVNAPAIPVELDPVSGAQFVDDGFGNWKWVSPVSADLTPVVDEDSWQKEWDEFAGHPFDIDTKVNAKAGTGFMSITNGRLKLYGVDDTSAGINVAPGAGFDNQLAAGGKIKLKGIASEVATINASPGKGFSRIDNKGVLALEGVSKVQVETELKGRVSGSDTLSDVYGKSFDTRSELKGKVTGSKVLDSVYGTSFDTYSKLKDRVSGTWGLQNVYGSSFNVQSNLTGKSKSSKTLQKVYGSVFTVQAKLDTSNAKSIKEKFASFFSGINVEIKLGDNKISGAITAFVKKNKAAGGAILANGLQLAFAAGGVIRNGIAQMFAGIQRYAGGTANAHGTMFIAGEAGPEIVGHIGGRTEVLNRSQLAQTMYSAVRSAMSGIKLDANIYHNGNSDSRESDYETMYKAMYDAFTAAMAKSESIDMEKVALLRQINEKEMTVDVSTAAINQAQTRMNRRTGTTVVAVATT